MKKHLFTTMAVAMFMTTIAVASARAQNAPMVSVSIPFDFEVAGKTMKAGDYQVRLEGSRSTLKIENRDTLHIAFATISPLQRTDIQDESKLVFNRYGSQYFLSQVWIAGSSSGEEVRQDATERSIRRELAALRHKPERVEIAVRTN
jgi:hypothetical protein